VGSLGNGINAAAIYTQGGGTQLLALDGIQGLSWGRARKAISTGQVLITGSSAKCWGQLGDVHTWQHELVFFRDGHRVWEGPVRRIGYKRGSVQIDAYDVLGWLKTRKNFLARQLPEGTESPVSAEAELIVRRAFAAHDPNVLPWLRTISDAAENKVTRDVAANSVMYDADLDSLSGLAYTTIGRGVVLFPDHVGLGRTETLIPERDMLADVEVVEVGNDLVTRATAMDGTGLSREVVVVNGEVNLVTGVSDYYGLHDKLITTDSVGAASLVAAATTVGRNQYPAPVVINVPADATLNCDAPISMVELVPGTIIPIESSVTPRTVSATTILDSMTVAQDKDGEKVTVTLAPPSGLTADD
jgi:hypothetical protein